MSDSITVTINGQQIQAKPGTMLIDVADDNNIIIPRFCYHKKLSVAANCRMCLVEIEKAPKPMPACATPCNDGMVVKTRSSNAIAAQKSTMEFLLINHPLDCPICDQGGECELQDVAMGYGDGVSQYSEQKRVVKDKDIGPLIAMEMTRCIHCTRCVRFGDEIAGLPELGATGRGENVEIGTYIEKSVTSELSGNVIDICPVGALTAKPSRYQARAWEMNQHASIAPHDCVGSNIFVHTRNNDVIRVVPRENELINESWISDRDRFSYEAITHEDRILQPRIRQNGKWQTVDWETAINAVAEKFSAAANKDANGIAALISPQTTLEEQYLAQKLIRGLGSNNLDHRFRQVDFSAQDSAPVMPWLGRSIESLESLDACLIVAGNLRHEQPILSHRLRKAVVHNGAEVSSLVHVGGLYNFNQLQEITGTAEQLVHELAAVVVALAKKAKTELSSDLIKMVDKTSANKTHNAIAESLLKGEQSAIIIGQQASASPHYSLIMQLSETAASLSGATLGYLSDSANSQGAALAGVLPHRVEAGLGAEKPGQNTAQILTETHQALLLMGLDPELDIGNAEQTRQLRDNNEFIVAINSFTNDFIEKNADVILPMAAFTETSGTFVNIEGFWQSFKGCVSPQEDVRPGWKIAASLGQVLLPGDEFEYLDSAEVRDELKQKCRELELNNQVSTISASGKLPTRPRSMQKVGASVMFSSDQLCRRAKALQLTESNIAGSSLMLNAEQAKKLGVVEGQRVQVKQNGATAVVNVALNDGVPAACVWLPQGVEVAMDLAGCFGGIELETLS